MLKIFADVVQVSYHTFATYPILARIDDGQHYIMHNASPASTVIHLLGGLDGTGGLSIIGVLARDVSGTIPQWIAIHVVDNHQVQDLADSKSFVAYKVATSEYGHQCGIRSHRPCDECPGNLELSSCNRMHWTHQENL